MQKLFGLLGLLALAGGTSAQERPPIEEAFTSDVLLVETKHACRRFDVYLALDRGQQARGLMFVRELPDTTGMLFIYPREQYVSIWMKNTYIPLDVIFARESGDVSYIHENAEPQSQRSIYPGEHSQFVLEINGGLAAKLGIEPGSVLLYDYLDALIGGE